MPRKGENIYKRKDGRWEGRYIKGRSPQGKALYGSVYGRSYLEVKEKLRNVPAVRKEPAAAAYPFEASAPAEPPAEQIDECGFSALAEEWLNDIRPRVKASTYMKYRNLLRSYLIPHYRKQTVGSITEDSIRACCQALLADGGAQHEGLSRKTVADTLSVFRSVLRYAADKGIAASCTGKEVTIKRPAGELNILQKDEQARLCRYLMKNISGKNLGIFLCLFTGLRIGELCALRWSDISFERRTIHIHQTIQRLQTEDGSGRKTAILISTPKSECSIRTIPLPGNVQQVIEQNFPNRQGYVLTGNSSYMEPRTLQKHFQKVLKEAQISPVKFHALRHTFATRCVEVGFDVKSLSEILGHSNVSITMNRYVHPTMEMKIENMQKLSALFAVG